MKTTDFKIGDTAEAATDIWRFDRRSLLRKGERCKIKSVFQLDENSHQIVDLDIGGKHQIGDVACRTDGPLKRI